MTRWLDRLRRSTWIGLAGIGLGTATLIVLAWVEYLNNPGTGLVDGYWVGRMPWTAIGVGLMVGGASLAVLASALLVAIRGDWLRRLLLLPVLALPALWWATAVGVVPMARYRPFDPIALAYSLPETAALALILPALAGAGLAFAPMRPDQRAHMRPVHSDAELAGRGEDFGDGPAD